MATNLLIGYPHIPWDATSITLLSGTSTVSGFDIEDMVSGSRGKLYEGVPHATSFIFAPTFVGPAAEPDFYAVLRGNLLTLAGCTQITLKRATPSATVDVFPISATNLIGPRDEDLVRDEAAFTSAGNNGAFTDWTLEFFSSASPPNWEFRVSKIFLGSWFDFGREPSLPYEIRREILSMSNRESRYIIRFHWDGISETQKQNFISKILKFKDVSPIILYTKTNHDPLDGHQVLHAWIRDVIIEDTIPNRYKIIATFEEAI